MTNGERFSVLTGLCGGGRAVPEGPAVAWVAFDRLKRTFLSHEVSGNASRRQCLSHEVSENTRQR